MVSEIVLAVELEKAVELGQIRAVFQPQFDLASGRAVAVEALSRWNHPGFGMVPPNEYIPVAEAGQIIHSLGRFMIDQALDALIDWRAAGMEIEVAVNVSAAQLTTLEFYDRLDDDLEHRGLPPGVLTIEITESQPILQTPSVITRLSQLRREGLGVSIDDYGVGYSFLDQLERLPATELKIDQSLIQDDSPEAVGLVKAVTELAHWRDIIVVAEGIETQEQLDRVRLFGCDRAQGYFLARPVEREEVAWYFA